MNHNQTLFIKEYLSELYLKEKEIKVIKIGDEGYSALVKVYKLQLHDDFYLNKILSRIKNKNKTTKLPKNIYYVTTEHNSNVSYGNSKSPYFYNTNDVNLYLINEIGIFDLEELNS